MNRNKTASSHNFAIVPGTQVPRSRFRMKQTRKQSFDASLLIPIMVEEVLPGDVWEHREAITARLATPIAPLVDDLDLETFYFQVSNRILDPDWEDFITGVDTAGTTKKVLPYISGVGHVVPPNGVLDHMGILPQTYSADVMRLTAYPIWGYFEIYNQWFRDQNLQPEWEWPTTTNQYTFLIDNGAPWNQLPLRANKRHDIFTASLPWPQKGTAVTMPLGSTAPIVASGTGIPSFDIGGAIGENLQNAPGVATMRYTGGYQAPDGTMTWNDPALEADLSAATGANLNSLRLAIATQQLLELDARGGSRYVENLVAHWGVRSPDFRLNIPEYIGGSRIPITINPVAQTAAYDAEPALDASPVGNLGAEMHAQGTHRTFRYAATEHGYIIGLALVRATPTYQQGTRAHWRREGRLEYYDPVFANIGETAVDTQQIYQNTTNVPTNATWGYQEAWAEYRYTPNEITGQLRSTFTQPMDWWHLSEEFGAEPALNAAFITDKTQETLARCLAVAPNDQWSAQIIMDINHDTTIARLMPTYSVPGLKRF